MSKQKKLSLILLLVISALLLPACERNLTGGSPTSAVKGTDTLAEVLTNTIIPDDDQESTISPDDMMETMVYETLSAELDQFETSTLTPESQETAPAEATATQHIITPTNTPEPTSETAETAEATQAPEDTQAPTNTNTPKPTISAVKIDPYTLFTGAQHVDTMDTPSLWTDENGLLPDTQYLKLEFADGNLYATGKLNLWDTWWISGFTLTDFYIEMEVNSGDCSGSDTYGMILRASQHGEPTRGYFIGFTCDGKVLAKRLESTDPYVAISILNPTETELINAGPNQTNIIGVAFEGDTITIYPNRYFFTTIVDSTFSYGRYGIYVQAGEDGNYTFIINEIRTWGIITED